LPKFHAVPGIDSDPNLAWIDRETAMHRILGQKLLFPPGTDHAHSHSAWVLLAAIIEKVSRESYQGFLTQYFFDPAGITRTGQHEDAERFPDDQFAIGYGGKTAGAINCPKYWGRTSWLVMGSGGMESTPGDLYRWLEAIRSGKTLSPASAARYWSHGLLAGGDVRGYLCMYREGPGDYFILCANGGSGPDGRASAVAEALDRLVSSGGGAPPKFSLGIQMDVTSEGAVTIQSVVPGGAAANAGLRVGDRLISAAGQALGDPPLKTLAPLLQTGESIAFEIERNGERRTIAVKPLPKK